jgi:hypothetical protein
MGAISTKMQSACLIAIIKRIIVYFNIASGKRKIKTVA